MTIRYRPEIDGLRALAVTTVVLFHADLGLTSGGFIGVDVFFVISGYLITGIIASQVRQGTFSLLGFYERRIRRIFPALFVVLAACLVLGAWRMTPLDYLNLGRSAAATIGFHSNFWFADRAGYFMPAAETLPLLHTWSLGVEEQFYVVAPLLLMAGVRLERRWLATAFWSLLVIALAVSVWGVYSNSETAFYLPHTRAFELMIGAGLALNLAPTIASVRLRQALSGLGLGLILAAAWLYDEMTPFPGLGALVPCLGAALIVHCADGFGGLTMVGRALAARPIVALGKVSYSLYLWHWPLFAFAQYEWANAGGLPMRLAIVAVSLVLAAATYRYIEQPARQSRIVLDQARVYAGGLAAALVLLAASLAIMHSRGWPGRLDPEVAALAAKVSGRSHLPCRREKLHGGRHGCLLGVPNTDPTFLLWGDSHASALEGVFDALASRSNTAGLIVARGGCVPVFEVAGSASLRRNKCAEHAANVREALRRGTIRHVVLVARWALYAFRNRTDPAAVDVAWDDLERLFNATVEELVRANLRVTVIGPVPELPVHLPSAMIKARMHGTTLDGIYDYALFQQRLARVLAMLREIETMHGVNVVYAHKALCPNGVCDMIENGLPLYRDSNHLSQLGAEKLMPDLARALRPDMASR